MSRPSHPHFNHPHNMRTVNIPKLLTTARLHAINAHDDELMCVKHVLVSGLQISRLVRKRAQSVACESQTRRQVRVSFLGKIANVRC